MTCRAGAVRVACSQTIPVVGVRIWSQPLHAVDVPFRFRLKRESVSGDGSQSVWRRVLGAAAIVVTLLLLVDSYTTRRAPPHALTVATIVLIGYTELARIRERGLARHLADRHFHRPSRREFAGVIAALLGMYASMYAVVLLVSVVNLPSGSGHAVISASSVQSPGTVFGYILLFFLFVAPFEEFVFRHFVQRRVFGRWFGPAGRVGAASLVFAVAHVTVYGATVAGAVSMTQIFTAGLVLGTAYEATENLVVPAATHAMVNTTTVLLLFLL